LILADDGVKVIEGCYRNVTARHALDLKRVLYLTAGQFTAHMALEAVNFLTDNFARYRLISKILSRQTQQ